MTTVYMKRMNGGIELNHHVLSSHGNYNLYGQKNEIGDIFRKKFDDIDIYFNRLMNDFF